MTHYASVAIGLFVATALFSGPAAHSSQTPVQLQLDAETTIDGVGVACTGVGDAKDDPRWQAYPVRVEFANPQHEYLVGETVTLSGKAGAPMFSVTCGGPWLLLKFPDHASYRLDARMNDADTASQNRIVKAPAQGQERVVLTFPGT